MWSQKYQTAWPLLEPSFRSEGGHPLSADKFQQIAQTIARLARIKSSDIVYDLGCSIGAITQSLSQHCRRIIGVDFLQNSIDFARKNAASPNIDYVCADIIKFQFNPPVDCIILNNVIHNLDSRTLARCLLQNCFASLKPRGRLYLGEVPDIARISRSPLTLRNKIAFNIHRFLPGPFFPLLSFITRRPLDRMLLYSRQRIARILNCPLASIAAFDEPALLLNPIDRIHYVVEKPR
jgi:SAM-dependent methyltransferase